MTPVIWKYVIEHGITSHEIPRYASVISCGYISGQIVIWAMVFPDKEKVTRKFYAVFTGEAITEDVTRLTAILHGGPPHTGVGTVVTPEGLAVHIFELK